MANTLRFKRGLTAGLPASVAGEPLFTTDTFDLYIGNGTTNTRFQKYIASGTTLQYLRGDGTLATFPILTGFVPYTGATANLDLGVFTILAQNATFASNGSTGTATINHSSGSGIALNITKGGNGEGLYINKTSGSGNAATILGTLNATTLVKSGGLSTEYLKADGSVSTLTNPITGTGASGQVAYWSGASTQAGDNGLTWDSVNKRLSINTSGQGRTITTFYGAGSDGQNIFIGGGGLSSRTGGGASSNGSYNTANGVNALFSNTTGYFNTANGASALFSNTTGHFNTANGASALRFNTTGNNNTANGGQALFSNTTGSSNKANGVSALYSNTTGNNNTANGVSALYSNTTGNNNTANGVQAGYGTGTNANTTGNNNIFIGNESVGVSATESNRTWIGNSRTTSTWLSGNLLLGSTINGTQTLQVTGTMLVTGASTFGGNLTNTNSNFQTFGSTNYSASTWGMSIGNGGVSSNFIKANNQYFQNSTGVTGFEMTSNGTLCSFSAFGTANYGASTWGIIIGNGLGSTNFYKANTHNFQNGSGTTIFSVNSAGAAAFSSSVTATAMTLTAIGGQLKLKDSANEGFVGVSGTSMYFTDFATAAKGLIVNISTGAATFSSSVQAATAIAIGTTPDTNKPFKILKNINAGVGINFENTSTGNLAFSLIQMGTDVSGGTAFTNLVYASSGVTEAGVYKPSGTSLVNTGAGGLNFLAVSQPIRFFTSSGNGTLRASITNDGDFTQFNGTNPSASTTDAFRMYSADIVAGNAAPHFRTENGAVVKIYQETTGVGNAIFSAGGGTGVLDDSTFDGYTLRQIVKALRNQGILA